ncbi:MAG: alpha/beta fold hydrolase [Anaerolineae bacterium]|nr:alpha/beta fold hydrolase [Anaerolineae bacterium]NIN96953.1 alpha/beta fold hydrolase [Anaerolineae bacterium]NIQ79914.1 alpha/beta fold hydrolase [Anaerolineae bacterium]
MALPKYEDHYIQVDGKSIRYWAEGEGRTVILVHGLSCSAEFWQRNIGALSQQHRVYALDLLGFGRSDKEIDEWSLSYGASFIAQFMHALGAERATVVGNSFGGILCAQFAVQFPSRLEKLVLVDSAGFGRELNFLLRLESVRVLGRAMFSLYQRIFPLTTRWAYYDPSSVDEEWLAETGAILRSPGVRDNALKVIRMGVDLGGQREELFGDLHRQLAHVTAPTLIIWGSDDALVPVSHAYAAHKLIPNSQVRIVQRCGHLPQVERPEEFNQLLLDFLSGES